MVYQYTIFWNLERCYRRHSLYQLSIYIVISYGHIRVHFGKMEDDCLIKQEEKKHQHIEKAVRLVARIGTGPRSLSADSTGQHGQWDHGFRSHSEHTCTSAFFFCALDFLFMHTLQYSLIAYPWNHTKPGLENQWRGGGAWGESESERLTDSYTCRWTDSQTDGNMKMLCYIFRCSFISLQIHKWYTLLEQALAT